MIGTRYSYPEIDGIWDVNNKVYVMRNLWVNLAKIQWALGVKEVTLEGIRQLEENVYNIDMKRVSEIENEKNHDIMAHIEAYSELCPKGAPFLHLGATSNFINDNVDSILINEGLKVIESLVLRLESSLKKRIEENMSVPCLGYTHGQQAQLITIGHRFARWLSDLKTCANHKPKVVFRGARGTVGTEDTLMKLFDGDEAKCDALNEALCKIYGFEEVVPICGQTYSRIHDIEIISYLNYLCLSLTSMALDIRLLSSYNELYEKFGDKQVGSSAMPFKRNPITCENITSLTRLVKRNLGVACDTYDEQWLERSLDDSACRRVILPETFILTADCLNKMNNVITGMTIDYDNIQTKVSNKMINIISEKIIIEGVKQGMARVDVHEKLRVLLVNNKETDVSLVINKSEEIKSIYEKGNISLDPLDYIGRTKTLCQRVLNKRVVVNDEFKIDVSDVMKLVCLSDD